MRKNFFILIFILIFSISSISFGYDAGVLNKLGWEYLSQNNEEKALQFFEKALQKDKNLIKSYEGLGIIKEKNGDFESAFKNYLKIIEIEPKSILSLIYIYKLKEFKKLIKNYDEITTVYKDALTKDIPEDIKFEMKKELIEIYELKGKEELSLNKELNLGEIDEWMIIGPFAKYGNSDFEEIFPPEEKIDLDAIYQTPEGEIKWIRAKYGLRDFSDIERIISSSYGVVYLLTNLYSDKRTEIVFRIRTDTAIKLWLNNKLILQKDFIKEPENFFIDAGCVISPGWNRVLIKVMPDYYKYSEKINFSLRITDKEGKPINLKIEPDIKNEKFSQPAKMNFESTFSKINKFLEKNKKDPFSHYYRAIVFYNYKDEESAYNEMDKAIEKLKNFSFFYSYFAKIKCEEEMYKRKYVRGNKIDEAKQLNSKAKEIDENNLLAHYFLGWYQYSQKRYKMAIEEFKKVIEMNKNFAKAHYALGLTFLQEKWKKEAEEELRKAIELNPYLVSAYLSLGDYYKEENNLKEGWIVCKEGIEKISSVQLFYKMAEILKLQNKNEEAIKFYEKIISLKPYEFPAYYSIAEIYRKMKLYQEAEKYLKEILDISYQNKFAYYLLGEIYEEKKDIDKAINNYEEYLKFNPSDLSLYKKVNFLKGKKNFWKEYSVDVEKIIKYSPDAKKYPKADSITLLDSLILKINKDKSEISATHKIGKILNQKGKDDWKWQESYSPQEENFEAEIFRTILPDGEINYPTKSLDMEWGVDIFPMEQLQENSIVEYSYIVRGRKPLWFKYLMMEFYFNSYRRGTDFKRLILIAPRDLKINFFNINFESSPNVIETEENIIYIWEKKDIQGIEIESFMPPSSEIFPYVRILDFKFEDVIKYLRGMLKGKDFANYEIKKKVKELTERKKYEIEKIKAIYYFVNSEIKGYCGCCGIYVNNAKYTFAEKSGNEFDKLILTKAMLKEIGIKSEICFLSKREYGNIRWETVFPYDFNSVLLYIPSQNLFLDFPCGYIRILGLGGFPISSKYLPAGSISWGSQRREALKICDDKFEKIITPYKKDEMFLNIKCQMEKNGDIKGKGEILFTGVWNFLKEYLSDAKNRDKYIEMSLNFIFPGAGIKELKFVGIDEKDVPLKIVFEFFAPNFGKRIKKEIRFRPVSLKLELKKNFIIETERKYPFMIPFPMHLKEEMNIEIPEKFKIKKLPEDIEIKETFASYLLNIKKEEKKINIKRDLAVESEIIPVSSYGKLVDVCKKIDEKEFEKIIIEEEE